MKNKLCRQELNLKVEQASNDELAYVFRWFLEDISEEVEGFKDATCDFDKGLQMGYRQVYEMLSVRLETIKDIYANAQ